MEAWKNELVKVIAALMGGPDTAVEMWAALAVAVFSCVAAMRLTAGVFGLGVSSWPRALFATLVPVALSLAAVVALRIYLPGSVDSPAARLACQIGAAVVIALGVGVPLQCLLLKGNYVEALLNLCASLAIAALVTIGFRAGWEAVTSGRSNMAGVKRRKEMIDAETGQ